MASSGGAKSKDSHTSSGQSSAVVLGCFAGDRSLAPEWLQVAVCGASAAARSTPLPVDASKSCADGAACVAEEAFGNSGPQPWTVSEPRCGSSRVLVSSVLSWPLGASAWPEHGGGLVVRWVGLCAGGVTAGASDKGVQHAPQRAPMCLVKAPAVATDAVRVLGELAQSNSRSLRRGLC